MESRLKRWRQCAKGKNEMLRLSARYHKSYKGKEKMYISGKEMNTRGRKRGQKICYIFTPLASHKANKKAKDFKCRRILPKMEGGRYNREKKWSGIEICQVRCTNYGRI